MNLFCDLTRAFTPDPVVADLNRQIAEVEQAEAEACAQEAWIEEADMLEVVGDDAAEILLLVWEGKAKEASALLRSAVSRAWKAAKGKAGEEAAAYRAEIREVWG